MTSHITALFGISPQTVRNWSEEFARYLSALAAPGRGRNRQFSEDDMRVFSLVAALKKSGATNEDIHLALASGQRGDLLDMHPDEVHALVVSDHAQAVLTLKQRIEVLQVERNEALSHLQKARDENNQLHGNLKAITDQLNAALAKIDKLNREIGRLESRMDND